MTKQETLQKIAEALFAIRDYKSRYIARQEPVDRMISERSDEFINEIRALGPAGSLCPRCNGSGRL